MVKPNPRKPPKRTIRQTSDRVSSLASAVEKILRGVPGGAPLTWEAQGAKFRAGTVSVIRVAIPVRHVRTLCMSLINQDQTPGKRVAKRAGRKR